MPEVPLETSPKLIEGYPRLGSYMGMSPENAIIRKFGSLNLENVLYLQAELTHLEIKLREIQARDNRSEDEKISKFSRDWYWLDASADEDECEQFDTVMRIRAKLKEYNDAVLQQSAMALLPKPNPTNLESLRGLLERPSMGNFSLTGEDWHTWAPNDKPIHHEEDLIALRARHNQDRFSTFVIEKLVIRIHNLIWHRFRQPADLESGIVFYNVKNLLRFTAIITTVIASLLPVLATCILYYLESMDAKLGVIAIFTFVFALCLTTFTNAKKGEIFTATTAFVAVEVVFVSGNGGISKY
ncbi:hypothetical protein PVAG01_08330 [Phlyctema vagabunda]|uniref:DUF6594 domain-containing protein n=1 Tax=Phlyctema vagabunda TaxID=108571 RepID=A0ABR4P9A8_9HELO